MAGREEDLAVNGVRPRESARLRRATRRGTVGGLDNEEPAARSPAPPRVPNLSRFTGNCDRVDAHHHPARPADLALHAASIRPAFDAAEVLALERLIELRRGRSNEAAAFDAAEVACSQAIASASQAAANASGVPADGLRAAAPAAIASTMSNSALTRKRYFVCERSPPCAHHWSARAAAAGFESLDRRSDYITMAARRTPSKAVLPRLSTFGSTLSARPRSRMRT